MPTFTDGTVVHATSLNTIATGINNLGVLLTGVAATRQVIPTVAANINTTHAISNNADTQVSFDVTLINEDNLWIPSVGHPVVNTAGIYVAWLQVNFDYNATGVRAAHILLNGTSIPTNAVAAASGNPSVTSGIGTAFLCISPPLSLAVGANIYVTVYQNSGANLNIIPNESGTCLSLIRVGD